MRLVLVNLLLHSLYIGFVPFPTHYPLRTGQDQRQLGVCLRSLCPPRPGEPELRQNCLISVLFGMHLATKLTSLYRQ